MVQDGPPAGGFPSVRYARRLPATGPKGPTLFLASAAVMAYGFYLVRHRRALPPPYATRLLAASVSLRRSASPDVRCAGCSGDACSCAIRLRIMWSQHWCTAPLAIVPTDIKLPQDKISGCRACFAGVQPSRRTPVDWPDQYRGPAE